MKKYRNNELNSYIIVAILAYFIANGGLNKFAGDESESIIQLIINILNILIVIVSIYTFVCILDSVYSGPMKKKLVFLASPEPGEIIFDYILKRKDRRFSRDDILTCYHDIYEGMPADKEDRRYYQNQQWYRIYHKYKKVDMVASTGKDFRLCRDIYIATINVLVVYLVLCMITNMISLNVQYILFLIVMMIVSNIAARNKGLKWVYNSLAHDITEKGTANL